MKLLHINRNSLGYRLNELYRGIGISKQAFHQKLKRDNFYGEECAWILHLLRQIRQEHPKMGCKILYYKIQPQFLGRDRFYELCRQEGFLVESSKNYRKTTDSTGVIRFDNLLKDLILTHINQVWSSDITYFDLNGKFYYITLITDNYSNRVLGYNVSGRINTISTTIPALKMAIKNRGNKSLPAGIILHSDGGGQYYAGEFLKITNDYKFQNSMCKDPWENGLAERMNGIMKNDYLKPWNIQTLPELVKGVDRFVVNYNTDRPIKKLGNLTPIEFEKKIVNLQKQKQIEGEKSIDENNDLKGYRAPLNPSKNKSPAQISSLKT